MAENTTPASGTQTKSAAKKKWTKAVEKIIQASSAPWLKPDISELQIKGPDDLSSTVPAWMPSCLAKPDLKSMQSLSECVKLLQKLSEEVSNINQGKHSRKEERTAGGSREPESLEISKSLILSWASELEMNMANMKTRGTNVKSRRREKERPEEEKLNDRLQQWAVELRHIKEAHGVSDDELKKLLYPKGSNKSRMSAILPLLEFVAWSLLADDTEEAVSKMWLPSKQKAWKTTSGNPKYIPNSVWQWIQSAAVSVRFDVSTCHPWLKVSSDRLHLSEAELPSSSPSQSQSDLKRPFVLGDTIISAGRHYWEVEVLSEGYWRFGVMSKSALKKKSPTLFPRGGFYTLLRASRFWACDNTPVNLQKVTVPTRVGVYVDVEEGQVSFYDAAQRVHVYTFSDTFKHGLIPVFGWLEKDTLLRIRPADLPANAQGKHVTVMDA
ncbi:nuclear factor 7, brain-like [Cheilinus undulatus]|uniref:nuclear factor 7, brain-like n=1 Tax=Cheilinus undulatus TaxID=241271 RepID=UPI001BD279C0|nr:nuclear factor 7, brain-like [Cheilinus undulatus]XP_041634643.1 nuclear factor 7, brain-like [Cheilinus undulatus]XP_041634644.1 nuclear factor 7, brain-like [Cheilinus undulatus]